jgi:hypothetical protein
MEGADFAETKTSTAKQSSAETALRARDGDQA